MVGLRAAGLVALVLYDMTNQRSDAQLELPMSGLSFNDAATVLRPV